jgi:transcriptional regulator with XRE-family HTH domain
MKAGKARFRSESLQWVYDRYVGDDLERVASFEEALASAEVARDIYLLRTKAGLTQKQLAERVGTTASVISRLEDAEYEGHSLSMLRRIAGALGMRVEIRFLPAKPKAASAPAPAVKSKRRSKQPVPRIAKGHGAK